MVASAIEIHHRVPRCLLGIFDRAVSGELDALGLQAWFEWEDEAFRYSVDPDISREDLITLIASSAAQIPATYHRGGHSKAGDFARWGRLGGLQTLGRYGRPWFSLLARRRWGLIGAEQLAHYLAQHRSTKGGAV